MKQLSFDCSLIQNALKTARSAALCSDYAFFKLGACIFTNKKILVAGANTNKTNPVQSIYNKYRPDSQSIKGGKNCCHAEINTLLRLRRIYPGINSKNLGILVYREHKDGQTALAKPCEACEKALRDFGITHIYYTGNDSMIYEEYTPSSYKLHKYGS